MEHRAKYCAKEIETHINIQNDFAFYEENQFGLSLSLFQR